MRNIKFILSNIWFWLRNPRFEVGFEPFMPPEEKKAFMHFAQRAENILEYGGGGSTVWANQSGKRGTCVENNKVWIGVIQEVIENFGNPNNLTLIYANTGITGSYGMPMFGNYTPGLVEKGLTYVTIPFSGVRQATQYDLVLVDGRWRVSCCLYSALMIPKDVPILLDDYEDNRGYEILPEFFEIQLFGRLARLTLKNNINRLNLYYAFVNSLKNAE